jgi:transcriptional regulator with XRE-family HTH domain
MKGGNGMNQKAIGLFLKQLRNEKRITQEQLAEVLGVSGRTVSRWETGSNLPDLSILVQISEYYGVEIKEILNGERKSENMDQELKETLLKVADYTELEKQRVAQVGNFTFGLMFLACALAIVIQIFMTGNLSLVVGETVIMVVSGLVYIYFLVRNGVWERGKKNSAKKDFIVSVICTGIFSVVYYFLTREHADAVFVVVGVICFFIVFTAVSYGFLRMLAYCSRKKAEKIMDKHDKKL